MSSTSAAPISSNDADICEALQANVRKIKESIQELDTFKRSLMEERSSAAELAAADSSARGRLVMGSVVPSITHAVAVVDEARGLLQRKQTACESLLVDLDSLSCISEGEFAMAKRILAGTTNGDSWAAFVVEAMSKPVLHSEVISFVEGALDDEEREEFSALCDVVGD